MTIMMAPVHRKCMASLFKGLLFLSGIIIFLFWISSRHCHDGVGACVGVKVVVMMLVLVLK